MWLGHRFAGKDVPPFITSCEFASKATAAICKTTWVCNEGPGKRSRNCTPSRSGAQRLVHQSSTRTGGISPPRQFPFPRNEETLSSARGVIMQILRE